MWCDWALLLILESRDHRQSTAAQYRLLWILSFPRPLQRIFLEWSTAHARYQNHRFRINEMDDRFTRLKHFLKSLQRLRAIWRTNSTYRILRQEPQTLYEFFHAISPLLFFWEIYKVFREGKISFKRETTSHICNHRLSTRQIFK